MIVLNDAIGGASWVELAWLLTALAGLFLSGLNAWEAVLDYLYDHGLARGMGAPGLGELRRTLAVLATVLGLVALVTTLAGAAVGW